MLIGRNVLFAVERPFWKAGMPFVAGVDEVGRGALAGPLVAAAVILSSSNGRMFPALPWHQNVRDSKLLSPEQREFLFPLICRSSLAIGVGRAEPAEIDRLGLAAANRMAMERAVGQLALPPSVLIIDAMTIDADIPQVGLIGGDSLSISVAAASIVAKVTRDRLMCDLSTHDPRYSFARNKGYGTLAHRRAVEHYGPSQWHRLSFACRPAGLGR